MSSVAPRFVAPRGRGLVLLAGAAIALGALAVTVGRRPSEAPAPATLATPVFVHGFVPGRTLSYAIDYRSEGTLDGRFESAPATERAPRLDGVTKVASVFAGTFESTVVEVRGDGSAKAIATLVLTEKTLAVGGRASALPDDTFAPLARGFVVEYGRDGAVRGFAVEAGTHPIVERLASQVLSFFQLVVPNGTTGPTWEVAENDAIGPSRARYAVLSDAPSHADDRLVEKKVVRQEPPRATGALGRLLEAGRGAHEATLAFEVAPGRGIVVEAAGALVTEQILGNRRVGSSDSTVIASLREERRDDVAATVLRVAERERALAPARPIDPAPLREAEQKKRNEDLVASVDLPALVADAIAHPPAAHSRDAATYADILAAVVAVSAEGRAHLERILAHPSTGESAFLPIARAFGTDGSAESQAVLGRIVAARKGPDPAREAAMYALGHAEHPTDATVALLETVSLSVDDPWAYAAHLVLGRVAGQLSFVDPARGGPVVDRLVRRARDAHDDEARTKAIEALGNAGLPRLEPELAFHRASSAVAVRRAAVAAHRLVPTTTARDALLSALSADPDWSVRLAALDGVLLRPPDDTIADAIADRLEHDEAESVKKPAASHLMSLCPRSRAACAHITRLKTSGDAWTKNELSTFTVPP